MEQKVRERTSEIQAAAHEFESLFNSSQVGMMVLKGGRFFAKGNQRLADIFGYASPEEMEGLSMQDLHLNEKRFREFGETHYNRLHHGEVLQVEYQLKRKDGSPIWCSLSGKALDIHRPIDLDRGVLWILDDISSRKLAEQELKETLNKLERSNEELAQFAYVASHDLQEPLRAIVGFLQLLEPRCAGQLDEKSRQYIKRSVNAAHRMQTLIQDLLTLSRVNTKGSPFESTDLNVVVAGVLSRLDRRIEEKSARVTREEFPHLMVDPDQISVLFENLISNALKYNGHPEPAISIGCREEKNDYCFFVKDNGIGIESKFYERIFIVFQRLHGRQEYHGTGVGLTLCKKIVERHGGSIWVESIAGRGSTFFFTLPKKGWENDRQ
ncbi:MAG: ATP-binding protein [Desulfobacteraceae bacterium]